MSTPADQSIKAAKQDNAAIRSGAEIANHYGVDAATVRRWRREGMPAIWYNPKLVRYELSKVDEWLRAKGSQPRPAITPSHERRKANEGGRRGLRKAAERRWTAAEAETAADVQAINNGWVPPAGGTLDPQNVWGPGELDRWAAAAIEQQRLLVRQAIRLLDKGEHQMLHRTLLLQAHWFGVSERIQQLRTEMQK